ncbi:MAG: pitrilysin family protein [Polyangiales bacterium]
MTCTPTARGRSLRVLLCLTVLLSLAFGACSREQAPPPEYPPLDSVEGEETPLAETEPEPEPEPETPREPPPESGTPRDIAFPAITRSTLTNGLELNTVTNTQLPVVYLQLVVRSGRETDPASLPGLSSIVADMLKEGTTRHTSAELAEEIEFLGADMEVAATSENLVLTFRALKEQLPQVLALMAEMTLSPAFDAEELEKLRRRELDRLELSEQDPRYLGRRAYYQALYGAHPYARVDTTADAVRAITQENLIAWHRTHVVPNNAYLVVVGDVTASDVRRRATTAFRTWRRGTVPEVSYPEAPTRTAREVIIVDRPGSPQTQIRVGNLAITRADEDWIPLQVANQVLGGGASSRLFMDLRERRSLTYGAYSSVEEREQVGPFTAVAAVRTEVTAEAMAAFFEHLVAISSVAADADETQLARQFLSNSFPLTIDTSGKIASMVASLRSFGLPDDYWESFRTRIGTVTPEQALEAAREHVRPEQMVVVLVGEAAQIAEPMRAYGPVTVTNTRGEVLRRLPARARR